MIEKVETAIIIGINLKNKQQNNPSNNNNNNTATALLDGTLVVGGVILIEQKDQVLSFFGELGAI